MPRQTTSDLTIVIPAFRCGKYLPATVASALRCDGVRIVIAEDRSGDDTFAVAKQLQLRSPDRIQVYENPRNLGMTANWQNALQQVQTEFVLKLDGDDLIDPPYVHAAMQLLRQRPDVGSVGGAMTHIGPDDYLSEEPPPRPDPIVPADFHIYTGPEAFLFLMRYDPHPASSSVLHRISVWRNIGGYDLSLGWCPDREILFRSARQSSLAFCPKPAVLYRVLQTSITASHAGARLFCYESDQMFRRARRVWPEAALRPAFRQAFRKNGLAFGKSALRALRYGRPLDAADRMLHALKSFANSL